MPKISALPPAGTLADDDETPFVDDSVGTTKKFTLAGLKAWLQSLTSWITTAMITDDAVTAAKIDWAAIGANGGIWWEELGRTELAVAGDTITVSGFPARDYLMIIVDVSSTGGTIDMSARFNNDATANAYQTRLAINGGADGTGAASLFSMSPSTGAYPQYAIIEVNNRISKERLAFGFGMDQNTAGASVPNRREQFFKYAGTAQVTRFDLFNSAGTGDYAIGSKVIVLGHN